jgi:hypothetical protein
MNKSWSLSFNWKLLIAYVWNIVLYTCEQWDSDRHVSIYIDIWRWHDKWYRKCQTFICNESEVKTIYNMCVLSWVPAYELWNCDSIYSADIPVFLNMSILFFFNVGVKFSYACKKNCIYQVYA